MGQGDGLAHSWHVSPTGAWRRSAAATLPGRSPALTTMTTFGPATIRVSGPGKVSEGTAGSYQPTIHAPCIGTSRAATVARDRRICSLYPHRRLKRS